MLILSNIKMVSEAYQSESVSLSVLFQRKTWTVSSDARTTPTQKPATPRRNMTVQVRFGMGHRRQHVLHGPGTINKRRVCRWLELCLVLIDHAHT